MFLANTLDLLLVMAVTNEVLNLFEPQNILSERGKAGTRGKGSRGQGATKKAKKICKA